MSVIVSVVVVSVVAVPVVSVVAAVSAAKLCSYVPRIPRPKSLSSFCLSKAAWFAAWNSAAPIIVGSPAASVTGAYLTSVKYLRPEDPGLRAASSPVGVV